MPTSVRSGAMVRLSVASDAKATIARQGAKGTSVEWNVKALNVSLPLFFPPPSPPRAWLFSLNYALKKNVRCSVR